MKHSSSSVTDSKASTKYAV